MARAELVEDTVEDVVASEKEEEVADGSGESGEETEYEIEAILDSKRGAFKKGEQAYLVKWKGYTEEHNSWVAEGDAGGAQELIDEFHKAKAKSKAQSAAKKPVSKGRKSGSAKSDGESISATTSSVKKGRGKIKEENGSSAGTKRKRKIDEDVDMDEPDASVFDHDLNKADYKPLKKSKLVGVKDWETAVKIIDTVELQQSDKRLYAFFTTVDGERFKEPTSTCAKKFPQKLIQFYESHLRWKSVDVDLDADVDEDGGAASAN